jgi:hypothetical protein
MIGVGSPIIGRKFLCLFSTFDVPRVKGRQLEAVVHQIEGHSITQYRLLLLQTSSLITLKVCLFKRSLQVVRRNDSKEKLKVADINIIKSK